jgi:hypothetical protein
VDLAVYEEKGGEWVEGRERRRRGAGMRGCRLSRRGRPRKSNVAFSSGFLSTKSFLKSTLTSCFAFSR